MSGPMSGHSAPSRAHGREAARTAIVWEALQQVLAPSGAAVAPEDVVTVLDIGGGTGGFAVRVAELGHRVTVVDPNPDALATLGRRADESGVADLVSARQGDLDSLLDLVPAGTTDVVLCHGVLEIVDNPTAALDTIADVLRPGGTLSLLVAQRHAAVVARAMAGHFQQARALLDDPTVAGNIRRYTAPEVGALLQTHGFDITATHAVRVFADLVPSSLVDLEVGSAQGLLELERAVADRPEYLPLGTQLHVLATRR